MADDRLDPQAEEVRRLLADARHTAPMPEDVVARLDATLAELAAEPARLRPVTDLATRRRRVTGLLVAAAAVVVLGVGVQQVVSPTSDDSGSADRATTAEDHPQAETQAGGAESAPEAPSDGDSLLSDLQSGTFAMKVRPDHFTLDAQSLQRTNSRAAGSLTTAPLAEAYDAAGQTCRAESWGRGTFVAVRYRRAPAVLVFRRAVGDTQVADLFLCGDTEPERSVTLPAP